MTEPSCSAAAANTTSPWYCGFLHGLYELNVDLDVAEMIVGTSAGAYAGSALSSGHFKRLSREFDFFGRFPGLFAKLAPVTSPNISQKRAQDINFSVKDGSPASIRAIGRAALAADNRLNGSGVERLAWLLTGDSRTGWPVARMFTTANDCYTGERLVVSQPAANRNGIPLAHAVAASSSLPGVIGPTLLGQRYCMDGGISRTWAHTDVVADEAGAGDHPDQWLRGFPAERHSAQHLRRDEGARSHRHEGHAHHRRHATGSNFLDPHQIRPALEAGYARAKVEAPMIQALGVVPQRRAPGAVSRR